MKMGGLNGQSWYLQAFKRRQVVEGPFMYLYTMISPTVPAGIAPPGARCSYSADPPDVQSIIGQPAEPFTDFPVRIIFD